MGNLLSRRFWILVVLLHVVSSAVIVVAAQHIGDGYCLQFRTVDQRGNLRLLLDVYTGKQMLTRAFVYRAYMPLYRFSSAAAPATSPDGKYTAYATYEGQTAYVWIEDEGGSERVLLQMPMYITLYEWVTDRHFVAVSVRDPLMVIAAIDLESGVPVTMREEFEIRNFDLTPPRIANAIQVRHVANGDFLEFRSAQFWVAERNAWVNYDLNLPTGSVGGLPLTPGYLVPKAVYSFEHQTVHGFVVVDPAHGINGVVTYPGTIGFHESFWIQWLPDGKHLVVRDSSDGGITKQLEVWRLDSDTPTLTGKGNIPPEATSIPIWAADGSSFVYTSTHGTVGQPFQTLNVHQLNISEETDSLLLDRDSVVKTFATQSVPASTTLLASTLRDRQFALYWISADGTTTLLADNGQHSPSVSFYGEYAYTIWQTATDRRLLIIDMKDAHHVSTPISSTLAIMYPYGEIRYQTDNLSFILLGSTDNHKSTFRVVDHRTGEHIQLLSGQGQVQWVAPSGQPQSDGFHVGWLTADGQRMVTVFSADEAPQMTFRTPQSKGLTFQPGHTKLAPDGSRAIVYEGLLGDHFLSFADGSVKELLPVPATLMWMPDGKHIVGVNSVLGNSPSEAYLMDADGTILARYPIPYPARLSDTPLIECAR